MRCAVKPLQPLQWLHFYDAIARVLQSHRNGFSVALHCHCGNRSERKHWNFKGCAAIALPFFLAWNYCDGFAKPLLGIMQPLQWFWEAIAMVLRSHCNGFAKPLQGSRWESWSMFVLHGFSFAALLLLSGLCCTDVLSCYLPHYNVVYMQSWERLRKTGWYRTERQPDR